jgi:hypothetical protein
MNAKVARIFEVFKTFLKITGEKIQSTHPIAQITSFLICLGIFVFLFFSIIIGSDTRRSVFFFPDMKKGRVRTEIRYLPDKNKMDERLSLYVSELLLGPITPNLRPLYNKGTVVINCFVRKNVAYIDLSSAALLPQSSITSSDIAYKLFKKNVCTNFRNIDKIYMYFDGIEVYRESLIADSSIKKR